MKGQAFFTEFLIVFVAIFILLTTYLFSLELVNEFRASNEDVFLQTQYAANNLLTSRGYPTNWDQNTSNVSSLGIVSKRSVIDLEKLNKFNLTKYKFLMGLERFNVSIQINASNLTVYETGYINTSTDVIVVDRTCVYNETPCLFKVSVSGG